MGFWYFLMLIIGGMMTVALFMFQDGSAEIVDSLLQSMNIRL